MPLMTTVRVGTVVSVGIGLILFAFDVVKVFVLFCAVGLVVAVAVLGWTFEDAVVSWPAVTAGWSELMSDLTAP